MAVISSLILNDDPLIPTRLDEQKASSDESSLQKDADNNIQQAILDEITALQEAMEADPDFDFSQLETTAAGNQNTQPDAIESDKSFSSPLLLTEADSLITYRSDTSAANELLSNASDTTINSLNIAQENTLLTTNNSKGSVIESALSEDFITRSSGQLPNGYSIAEQTIETQFGSFSIDATGKWFYNLNNSLQEVQQLASGDTLTDNLALADASGQTIQFSFGINGTNDQPVITGVKTGQLQANTVADNSPAPSINGKLDVDDLDAGEARFQTNFDIKGNFGSAEINALGEWKYTLDNNSDAIQGLRTGEKLVDIFSVKTLDGTKQLIQVSIEGVDDKPLLSGNNFAELNLESALSTQGKLSINDPDFGESSFQELSDIQSSLGFGTGEIDAKGNWTFTLDIDYIQEHEISAGQTRIDSFEIFTADGTSQMINIPIKGSDSPFYEQQANLNSTSLSFEHVFSDANHQNTFDSGMLDQATFTQSSIAAESAHSAETSMLLNSQNDAFSNLQTGLPDLLIS